MLDIKALKVALEQLEAEKKIAHEKVVDAVEKSLAAAYQKEYGKRGQIVRCQINFDTGETSFEQVKIVVDETTVRMPVEGEEEIISIAKRMKLAGANFLRGGAFKPRTSPYSFQGLELEGLRLLQLAKRETGLPIVSELMSAEYIDEFVEDFKAQAPIWKYDIINNKRVYAKDRSTAIFGAGILK